MDKDMLRQRQFIGIMGAILPIAIWISAGVFGGHGFFLPSISATYYMNSVAIFMMLMGAASVFLIFYQGYDLTDARISKIAGVGGLVLSLFPVSYGSTVHNFLQLPMYITNVLHLTGAIMFFAGISWMMLFQFTKSAKDIEKGSRKALRNKIYKVCGITMIAGLIAGFGGARIFGFSPCIYFGEAIALWAFGVGFLVKGNVLLKDLK